MGKTKMISKARYYRLSQNLILEDRIEAVMCFIYLIAIISEYRNEEVEERTRMPATNAMCFKRIIIFTSGYSHSTQKSAYEVLYLSNDIVIKPVH